MARILIVDDHPLVRQGIRNLLRDHNPDLDIDEAGSAANFLSRATETKWDAVLLDISLGDDNGLLTLRKFRQLAPMTPVLMLTMHQEDQYAQQAMKTGALGYITKSSPAEKIWEAVQTVLAGRQYLSKEFTNTLLSRALAEDESSDEKELSIRETQVLVGLVRGEPLKEMAFRLGISDKSISTYKTRIFKKLNVKTNAELISFALKNNLVDKYKDVI